MDDFFNDLAAEDPDLEDDFKSQATHSLFVCPEMNGKKIKVVSAASKRNGENSMTTTTATTTAPVSTSTSVNKRIQP